MKAKSETEELYEVQTENRHLKDTISAQRDALEKLRIEKDEIAQKVRSAASDEIAQIKAAVNALRDEMDRGRIEYEDKMQKLERDAQDENNQLKQTIDVLRGQIEKKNAKKQPGKNKSKK